MSDEMTYIISSFLWSGAGLYVGYWLGRSERKIKALERQVRALSDRQDRRDAS